MATAGVKQLINGPEGFTPDNEFILGETEVRGFWVAAGFSAHGIAGAGGMGRQFAHWIVDGEPEYDLWKMDIRRFGAQYRSRTVVQARATENYATYYDIHYPNEERQSARPLRLSPTYARLTELGCAFGEKSGWERPNWFDQQCPCRGPGAPPARLGRPPLVPGHRGRGAGHPHHRRPVRRDELREDRDQRAGRARLPPAPVRQ